jgi:Domain of Unknown Function (DUF326)
MNMTRRAKISTESTQRPSYIASSRSQDMSYARQMLEDDTASGVDASLLATAIEALNDCAHACTADADADLREGDVVGMVKCIRLCLDCTDVCTATVGVISRRTAYEEAVTGPLLEACAATCARCGEECERHAQEHPHCGVCAEACRRCEQACRDLLAAAQTSG